MLSAAARSRGALLWGIGLIASAAGAQLADPTPEVVREPTVPVYAEQNALEIINARLRAKRPQVTRTGRVRQCHTEMTGIVGERGVRLASLSPLPVLAMLFQGGAEGGRGGPDGPHRREVCVNVPVETPYTGDRAHGIRVDPQDVSVTTGEPVRVAVPDIISEYTFDIPNCSSTSQSVTHTLNYQVRVGDQVAVTNGVSVASMSGSQVSATVTFTSKVGLGGSASGQRSSSRTRTVTSTTARTESFDETLGRTATIPLIAPPMSRVTALARTSQAAYEVPFTIRMRLTGQLHPTSQYGAGPISAELTDEERTVLVTGFIRNFVAGEISFAPRQTPLTPEQCAMAPTPTLLLARPGAGAATVHLPQ